MRRALPERIGYGYVWRYSNREGNEPLTRCAPSGFSVRGLLAGRVGEPGAIPRRSWKIAGASLVLASVGAPQDLAPDAQLLSRIKSHMREELSHAPNYTCLETIYRFRRDRGFHPLSHARLAALDKVRLDIVYSNHREWYGSPGDRNLSEDHLAQA
jgi:hypothetical protein